MRLPIKFTLLALCAWSGASHAADDTALSSAPATPAAASDSTTLGLGVAYVPEYAGAQDSRLVVLPVLERRYANGFFLSTMRGAGYQTSVDGVNLSAALTYGGGRSDHKTSFFSGSDALKGMGDIEKSVQAVLSASYRVGVVGLSLSTTQNLAKREYGATYTFGAQVPLYSDQANRVGLGASAVYGDDKHMQTYFGVTAAQSASSGYRAYTAKAGLETISTALNWDHVIDKNWTVHSVIGVSRLASDAADSPLTYRKTTPMLMTAFNYSF